MIGKILWYDARDGYGIIVGTMDDKEYYFDRSVFLHDGLALSGARVTFEHNAAISHCRCAKEVRMDLDHLAQIQYSIVEKLKAYGSERLREGAIDEALAKLDAIVKLKAAV